MTELDPQVLSFVFAGFGSLWAVSRVWGLAWQLIRQAV